MNTATQRIHKKFAKIKRDPLLTAKAAGLQYVSDTMPGWTRKLRGENLLCVDDHGKRCTDKATLERVRRMALPPAWQNVWICASADGHLQATGSDAKGRKQYRYHTAWNQMRSHTKYYRLPQFAEALPLIRERTGRDLKLPGFPYEKVLAMAVSIMEQTNIRVGNEAYKKLYGSFGLTTLQDKHVRIEGDQIKFRFKGKKGVHHDISLNSRKLARLVQQSKDIPGKELFQYYDGQGNHRSIGSGDVNAYLKEIAGTGFTAKDFRTWSGTVAVFRALRGMGVCASATEAKRNALAAIDEVARQLGNTRTVCRKYYIHPAIVMAYEQGELQGYFNQTGEAPREKDWLSDEEKMVKNVLENFAWQLDG